MEKILLVSDEFPPKSGGAGFVGKQIVEGLVQKNCEVTLMTNNIVAKQNKNLSASILYIKRVPYIWFLFYYLKFLFFNWEKYDKVIVNDANSLLAFSLFNSKKVRKKTTILIHGTSVIDNFYFKKTIFFRLISPFFRKMLKEVKNVLCVSEFMKIYTKDKYYFDNIQKWSPGIDIDLFKYNITIKKKTHEKIKVLTVSRVVKNKGFLIMYEELKPLLENGNIEWTIIGEGVFFNEFYNIVKKDLLLNTVKFKGKILREDLSEFYKKADIFLLYSQFKESLGLVYLEANFFGIPVIANNLGGPKEIIDPSLNGYLINDVSEITEILIEKRFLEFDRVRIHEFAKKFNLENTMNNLLVLLKK